MSLVIEALRRVEKTDARAGSIGAAVASYRETPRPRGSVAPLFLGLLTGGAMVFLFGPQSRDVDRVSARSVEAAPSPQARYLKGAAGLPPPLIIESALSSEPRKSADAGSGSGVELSPTDPHPRAEAPSRAPVASPSLVLQAISERDSRPIAIINDQLVNEGDRLGPVRVLRIGPDSVEVLLENGEHDTVRFSPPPPPPAPEPSTSPTPQH